MKIKSKANVFDAALARIHFLFDEFPHVVAGISGGKDSTVVYQLCKRVARQRGRLPLTVFFLDQEAEWTWTVEHVRDIMQAPDVRPLWFQMPMHLDNATSYTTKFLKCWDPACEADWIHPKDPLSIKVNRYGTDRFKELFPAIFRKEYPGERVAVVSGVRCEESPARNVGLTQIATYKWITWGTKLSGEQYTFYPLYDWTYKDVWHAICVENWPYNKIYDYQYRYGLPVSEMRVSNLHHETAVRHLFRLQEIDPGLYQRLARRLPGVDTAGKLQQDFYRHKLPFMFADWYEYRDHLIDKLCGNDPRWQRKLRDLAVRWDALFAKSPDDRQAAAKAIVQCVLCNDYTMTKTENFRVTFVGKYKKDRARHLRWENGQVRREQDPQSFAWFQNQLRGRDGVGGTSGRLQEIDGRRVYVRDGYRHWIEGDVLHREAMAAP